MSAKVSVAHSAYTRYHVSRNIIEIVTPHQLNQTVCGIHRRRRYVTWLRILENIGITVVVKNRSIDLPYGFLRYNIQDGGYIFRPCYCAVCNGGHRFRLANRRAVKNITIRNVKSCYFDQVSNDRC